MGVGDSDCLHLTQSDRTGSGHNGIVSFSQADLGTALAHCAAFADQQPWGSPDLLFALVPTPLLAAQAPELVEADDDSALSPVLQEPENSDADTAALLGSLAWPEAVAGCALVTEITVVPPDGDLAQSRQARLIGGALRTGARVALLAVQPHPGDDPAAERHLRTSPDLAPELLEALAATFDDA